MLFLMKLTVSGCSYSLYYANSETLYGSQTSPLTLSITVAPNYDAT